MITELLRASVKAYQTVSALKRAETRLDAVRRLTNKTLGDVPPVLEEWKLEEQELLQEVEELRKELEEWDCWFWDKGCKPLPQSQVSAARVGWWEVCPSDVRKYVHQHPEVLAR